MTEIGQKITSGRVLPQSGRILGSPVALSFRLAKKPLGTLDTNYGPHTYASLWGFDAPFDYVRFLYPNILASTVEITASYAASSAANDGFTPVGGAFERATFNALGVSAANSLLPPDFPPTTPGSLTNGMMPPGDGVKSPFSDPVWCAGDWMPFSPMQPTDGDQYWLMARTKLLSPYVGASAPFPQNYKSLAGVPRSFCQAVDGVSDPTIFHSPIDNPSIIMPGAVEVISRQPGVGYLSIGDSMESGYKTSSGANGYGGIVCMHLSKPSLPIYWINSSWPGQPSAKYLLIGRKSVEIFAPKIVTVKPFSPNDNNYAHPTRETVDQSLRNALALTVFAEQRGSRVAFVTAEPWGYAPNTHAELARQYLNAALRTMQSGGVHVIDMDLALRDSASPNCTQQIYVAEDNLHLNDAGQVAKASAAIPIIEKMIGISQVQQERRSTL